MTFLWNEEARKTVYLELTKCKAYRTGINKINCALGGDGTEVWLWWQAGEVKIYFRLLWLIVKID